MPDGYARRQPERTDLHRLVRENLETFLAELREDGLGLPRYVEEEFRSYIDCGSLGKGFCRVVCPDCGGELLVAFSCKKRGFCPSCCARRMSDTAAHLIDRVLPQVAYRQYVLAYPRRLRYAFAKDSKAATESVRIFLREVFRFQRRQARAQKIQRPLVGAVSVTQRHGSRVDLNIHHHCLLPDGIFAQGANGELGFVELSRPSREDLAAMLERIVARTLSMVARRGLLEEEPSDALGIVYHRAHRTGFSTACEQGKSGGQRWLRRKQRHAGRTEGRMNVLGAWRLRRRTHAG